MLSLVMILNNSDLESLAKCLKLLKSVLDPIMEIVQLMHGFLVVFTTFDKCVTKRSQEENALKTAKRGKLVLLTWTPTMFNFILVVILLHFLQDHRLYKFCNDNKIRGTLLQVRKDVRDG